MNVERFKERLLALERELSARIEREIEAAREIVPDQPAPEDLSVVDELKEEPLILAETDSEILAEVRAALQRIEDGTFGRCTVDGNPIEEKRLEAVPWAPYCLEHQRQAEQLSGLRTPTL